MEFLHLLESVRTPALSAFMSALTHIGGEGAFLIVAIVLFWCVSKRQSYYVFAVGICGVVANQWLKLLFRIPRPWVLDPTLTIVEAARKGAAGYSFPSGHTQNIVGTFGCLAAANRDRRLRAACAALMLLVPFSRMYLGVHTPLDVGASFVVAAALVLALRRFYRDEESFRRSEKRILAVMLVCTLAYAAWSNMTAFPPDVDAENLAEGVKNGWSLLGAVLGLIASYVWDEKKRRFSVEAPLVGQICKVVLGLSLLLALRALLKAGLGALTGGAPWAHGVRYFLTVIFAGIVWPMTFPFFARVAPARRGGGS